MSLTSGKQLLLSAAAGGATGYQVSRSLRFNSADSAYLSRTPGSAGNRKTWTWSGWVKRSKITSTRYSLFVAATGGNNQTEFFFQQVTGADTLYFYHYDGSYQGQCSTTAVFRDVSAWYHIVLAVDTTQATASNRCKIYVNGVQQDVAFTTNFTQNADLYVNGANAHAIGYDVGNAPGQTYHFDGYMADIYLLDGTATTPSTFAETDAITGQWVPKTPTGISYGTNGFRLPFSDNSGTTSTTLGKDSAGSNNWTPNNFSVASGSGNDSLVDTPTSYGTDTGAGGEVRGNYCTWNPLDTISGNTFSNGNLDIQTVTAAYGTCRGTIGVSTGKWYWEINVLDETGGGQIGILDSVSPLPSEPYLAAKGYVYFDFGSKGNNSSQAGYGASYTTGDLIGVALDLDTGTLTFYKNGSSQGTAYSGLPSGTVFFPVIADYQSANSSKFALNAGQRPFAYTAPSGFKALVDTNLTAPVIAKPNTVMDVIAYSGSGASRTFTDLTYSPDLVWIKQRSDTNNHRLYDVVRGATKALYSNLTNSEGTDSSGLTAFTSNGFTLGDGDAVWNASGQTYAAWCWDAGASTVTNTQGSITSQVRANASAGFSVATWTGTGSGSATVGHGLGVAPRMMIVKDRSNARNWLVYHTTLGASSGMALNLTNAASGADAGWWNNTSPTSTVATIGTYGNESANYVGYFWAPVVGYSSFGSYTGNGSADGPFVYTGFRPRWVMIKRSDSASVSYGWFILDTARNTYNVMNTWLAADNSAADGADIICDTLSNGFKIRTTAGNINTNAGTFVYACFAESPFAYARAR